MSRLSQTARVFLSQWRRDEQGVAAVEFAVIFSLIMALIAGATDLTNAQIVQRGVERNTVEISQALALCPNSDCVLAGINGLLAKGSNVLINTPGASLGVAEFTKVNGKIVVLQGTMTFLPNDIANEALALMDDNDVGIATLITYDHKPIFGVSAFGFGGNAQVRRFTVTTRAKNIKMV